MPNTKHSIKGPFPSPMKAMCNVVPAGTGDPALNRAGTRSRQSNPHRRGAQHIMSLGVLNNISALYAANNLNQTQASLQNVLTQLSSGSRINSGADDAAGLSLANGLTASATALSQSAKNASEGVDFLQVADGALSQVTNLLNRAVTLATEASNGTLNSTQISAANSEYLNIIGEINNINTNTEYNGIKTFGTTAAIYTSDGTTSQQNDTTALAQVDSTTLGLTFA